MRAATSLRYPAYNDRPTSLPSSVRDMVYGDQKRAGYTVTVVGEDLAERAILDLSGLFVTVREDS